MRFWEAMKALEEGKKVRNIHWNKGGYTDSDSLRNQTSCIEMNEIFDEWEIYEEPEQTYSFMEVIKGLREGKKFKRKSWGNWYFGYSASTYIQGKSVPSEFYPFTLESFEAKDWIEVKDP